MTRRFQRIRRFHFNLPQRIAAGLLAVFLAQGLWLTGHQTLTDRDYQYARCGREMWERPSQLAGYFTSCGNIHDGILAYRLAGLPLTLNLLVERGLGPLPQARRPRGAGGRRAFAPGSCATSSRYTLLLLRLPFLAAGCLLGAGLWWVTRRLYGNLGGYTALALYCFSPAVLRACVTPNPEVLAALGVYGGVYTCIGVAHAMQGPRRKWRPRIVLLTAAFGLAAASHIAALPVGGAAWPGCHALGRRGTQEPDAARGAHRHCRRAGLRLRLLRLLAGRLQLRLPLSRLVFCGSRSIPPGVSSPHCRNAGITVAAAAALALFLGLRRSRYFGNTTPLLCALLLFVLVMTGAPGSPLLWALPFLLTFIGGVFADAYEGPSGHGWLWALPGQFC